MWTPSTYWKIALEKGAPMSTIVWINTNQLSFVMHK